MSLDEKITLEWLAAEHSRIHVMGLWPDGPRKEAGLAAAQSALESVTGTLPEGSSFVCMTCASSQTVSQIPSCLPVRRLPSGLAA